MLLRRLFLVFLLACCSILANAAGLTLSSSAIKNNGTLPADLKCTRDHGDGLSPPISWKGAPDETKGYAVIMHHYPKGTVEGINAPSHYWLVWNIPSTTTSLTRGNPQSIGNEGSDKDRRHIGYTPPCSPGNVTHEYIITVYALDTDDISLGDKDNINVDWQVLTDAIKGHVIDSSSLTFKN